MRGGGDAPAARSTSAAAMLRWSAAAPSSSFSFVACTSADPSDSSATVSICVSPAARAAGDRVAQALDARPRSLPRPPPPPPTPGAPAARARPPPHRRAGGSSRSVARPRASSGPGSTPSSRRNRSSEAASCRSTATSSPVAANARTRSTWASSFKRIGGDQPGGELDRGSRVARRKRAERALAKDRLAQALEAAALAQQPRGEARARVDVHTLEQLASEPGELDRLARRAPHQDVDVDHRALGKAELHDVAAPHRVGAAEQTPELGQVPAQRARRVLGVGEQQVDELLPARRPAGQRQVGEQRPDLPAPRRRVDTPSRTRSGGPSRCTRIGMAAILPAGRRSDKWSEAPCPLTRSVTRRTPRFADGPDGIRQHRRGRIMSGPTIEELRGAGAGRA